MNTTADSARMGPVATPLPPDPALLSGVLDSGARFAIRAHGAVPGRVLLHLRAEAGSLHERDDERGASALITRLVLGAEAGTPLGDALERLRAAGGVVTDTQEPGSPYDVAGLTVTLNEATPEALELACRFLALAAEAPPTDDASLERARARLSERIGALSTFAHRLPRELIPRLAPGSLLSRRTPALLDPGSLTATPEGIRRFQQRQWSAPCLTAVVVGDADPGAVSAMLQRSLGALPAGRAFESPSPGAATHTEPLILTAHDADMPAGVVEMAMFVPARGSLTTVETYRAALLDDLAAAAIRLEVNDLLSQCNDAVSAGEVKQARLARGFEAVVVSAAGPPATWSARLASLARAVRHAVERPVTAAAFAAVRRQVLDARRAAAMNEPTLKPEELLTRLLQRVDGHSVVVSAAYDLDLASALLNRLTPEDLSAHLATIDVKRAAFIVAGPGAEQLPAEASLRLQIAALLAEPMGAALPRAQARPLLAAEPSPGAIVELCADPATGVSSAWLASGARVHHRQGGNPRGDVVIACTLAGGRIEEDEHTHGLTLAAEMLWEHPATPLLSPADVRAALEEASISVSGLYAEDSVTLIITCPSESVERAFQFLHAILESPRLDPCAFSRWRSDTAQRRTLQALRPSVAAWEVLSASRFAASEPRHSLPSAQRLDALPHEEAQRWVSRLAQRAPLEAAVTGDIPRARALELAAAYLGSLPGRERIDAGLFGALRTAAVAAGDHPAEAVRIASPGATRQGSVLIGFPGADASNPTASRTLDLAARVLTARLTRTLRDERGLALGVRAFSLPGVAYPGSGVFLVEATFASQATGRDEELQRAMIEELRRFALEGPDPADVAQHRSALAGEAQRQSASAGAWARALADLTYRGREPADALDDPSAYSSITAQQVHEVLVRYIGDPACEGSFPMRVVAAPHRDGDSSSPGLPGTGRAADGVVPAAPVADKATGDGDGPAPRRR